MQGVAARAGKRSASSAAALLGGAVALLALPSAVLAFSSRFDPLPLTQLADAGGFVPAEVDPRLARSITVRTLAKGQLFRFTPAATPTRLDHPVTVVARIDPVTRGIAIHPAGAGESGNGLGIASTAYSLGAARGYRSFAAGGASNPDIRRIENMPDLAAFAPSNAATRSDPARFAPRIALDEKVKAGRSPRTFEQSDQQVDLGGSYRVTGNLNVTAGVRYSSDRDRLVPLSDKRQDNQAVYVGTQFRF